MKPVVSSDLENPNSVSIRFSPGLALLSTAVKNSPPSILVKTPKVVEYAKNGGIVNGEIPYVVITQAARLQNVCCMSDLQLIGGQLAAVPLLLT